MKKVFSLVLSLVMLVSITAGLDLSVSAETTDYWIHDSILLDDGTIEIVSYSGSETNVTIPIEVDGHTVTSISAYAFYNYNSITSVTIPDSVTSIGNHAFERCESLASITIGKSVTGIGAYAFAGTALLSVIIPDSVTSIGNAAFGDCSSLTDITILNPECDIYNDAFTISNTAIIKGYAVSTAQAYAEAYGREFTEISDSGNTGNDNSYEDLFDVIHTGECKVSVTEDMTDIEHQTPYSRYYEEAYVYKPEFSMNYEYSAKVNVIGNNENTSVQLMTQIFDAELNWLYQEEGSSSVYFKYNFEAGKTYFVLNTLQIITTNVYVANLVDGDITLTTSIDLNASDVEDYLNNNCENDDPYNEGWKIGDEVYAIAYIYDDAVIGYIPNNSLRRNITSVIIPSKVDTNYSNGVIYNDTKITSMKIEYNSLETYSNLRNIYLPYSIEWIESIYGGCSDYEDLANAALKEINIPSSVKRIDGPAFSYCTALTNITIPESVESIGAGAFDGCSSLKDVTILNPKCDLGHNTVVFPLGNSITIHGYYGSTAQQHVKEMNHTYIYCSFSPLENSTIKADGLGASIRVSDAGLRFGFSYNEIQNYIGTQEVEIEEYGFVYAYRATNDLTVDSVGTNGVKQRVAGNKINHGDYTTFNLVFTNIPSSAFDSVVSARAYVKIDGEYYYSNVLQRSYRQVANAVLADDEIDDETKNAVREILGKEA